PLETKTPDENPPVFDEDIGLYVGQRPKVSIGNLATMENRLLRRPDMGKGWFGKDGLILTTPEPTHKLIIRPLIIGEDPNRHLIYREPRMAGNSTAIINKTDGVKDCQLEIYLGSIHFSHHPLFSREHVLSQFLSKQCEVYHKIDRSRLIEQYREQLKALQYSIQDLKQSQTDPMQASEQLERYRLEVRAKRQQLKQTGATEYQLMQNILKTWRELKQLREDQGYSCTTSQLVIHRFGSDAMIEQSLRDRDIEAELMERRGSRSNYDS
ncbi:PREDICTED: coiled-coil and C2 domain-containing protein 2A-like, partial [Amphimedon queenslandica]|uniref:DUF5523 domain-containing protein n=1 Tax=Amphimedon queenslandica TaxID=400682 RepID=A0AAN0JZC3_AMPQE